MLIYIYIYIYTHREREREDIGNLYAYLGGCFSIFLIST
jgi:hypothetical protein